MSSRHVIPDESQSGLITVDSTAAYLPPNTKLGSSESAVQHPRVTFALVKRDQMEIARWYQLQGKKLFSYLGKYFYTIRPKHYLVLWSKWTYINQIKWINGQGNLRKMHLETSSAKCRTFWSRVVRGTVTINSKWCPRSHCHRFSRPISTLHAERKRFCVATGITF